VSVTAAAGLLALSFVVLGLFGSTLAGLIVGTLMLDVAATMGLISNQARIYSLPRDIHSRVNTVYMVAYFTGGAAGSLLGAAAWDRFGWSGVCALGVALSTTALVCHLATRRKV
jgi:predicted MFS family arabinose efflux permease